MTETENQRKETVIITGICSNIGREVARRLHRKYRVIGIDSRQFTYFPPDIVEYRIDLRRRKSRDIFQTSNAFAVVHLALSYDPWKIRGGVHSWNLEVFTSILEYIKNYRISKLILLSTSAVYGPNPDNPQFIPEDHPLYGADTYPQMREIVEVDMLAQSFYWRNPSCDTVILRPVNIVGNVNSPLMHYLLLKNPPVAMGFDPMIQMTHVKDVARAIEKTLEKPLKSIFNISGEGQLPLSRILSIVGKKPVQVLPQILKPSVTFAFKLKLTALPPGAVNHLKYPCMVDTSRATNILKFTPRYNIRDCLEAIREEILWDEKNIH